MSNQNDIIELNGYRYDAKTGKMLGKSGAQNSTPRVKSIDGFAKKPVYGPKIDRQATQPTPSHSLHSKTTKSKTLMRAAVKKPEVNNPQKAEPDTKLEKRSFSINPERIERANQTTKSPNISKFGNGSSQLKPVEVKEAPVSPDVTAGTTNSEERRAVLPLSPFDMALQRSKSHEQEHINVHSFRGRMLNRLKITPRAASITAGMIVAVIAGGLYMHQHLPNLAVRLAATRAGVEAHLPNYRPSGFSLAGPIEYSSGEITLQYQSNSDDRSFTVVQKKSDWNSQTLLENFITASKKNFQTFQDKGKTIYIYDGNNATWVSGGVWYQVEGESSLNSDQLLRIASGL